MNEPSFDASSDPFDQAPSQRQPRPFLGIRFQCCKTYGRIYRSDEGRQYRGSCPACGAKVTVPIGSGGTSSRFFNAG